MNKDDTVKNGVEKVPLKILIPAYNDYPLKDMKHWMKKAYHKARIQVGWRKAKKIKETMPIETAAYAEDKVFGNWRLVAPSRDGEISPLQQAIEWLKPYIVPTHEGNSERPLPNKEGVGDSWGEFRRKFICELKLCFNAICDSDYGQKMVDEVNQRLNELLKAYCHTELVSASIEPLLQNNSGQRDISCHFVLKPETAEDYSSLRFLTIRSGIWMRFTGVPLDFTQFIKTSDAKPICRQMEMYLVLRLAN